MEKEIKVLSISNTDGIKIKTIENDLKAMQEFVGGWIEIVPLSHECCLVCNEEGKIKGLPYNMAVIDTNTGFKDIIMGDFFIASSDDEGELASIPEEVLHNKIYFHAPEHLNNAIELVID